MVSGVCSELREDFRAKARPACKCKIDLIKMFKLKIWKIHLDDQGNLCKSGSVNLE